MAYDSSQLGRWLGLSSPLGRDRGRRAATLRAISWTFIAANSATLVLSHFFLSAPQNPSGTGIVLGVIALMAACLQLVKHDRLLAASALLVAAGWLGTTVGLVSSGSLSTPGFSFYTVSIVAAGLLLGARVALLVALLSAASGYVVGELAQRGILEGTAIFHTPKSVLWIESVLFVSIAGLVYISVQRLRAALAESEASERALGQRNADLTHTLLEKQRAQEAEAALQSRLKQAEKHEALGRLAGGVAHDFNNLLVVIQGNARLLERQAAASPEMLEAAGQIVEAGKRAATLTGQLLSFGRQQVPNMRVVDLNEVIRQAFDMLRRLVPQNIEMEMKLSASLSHVEVDPDQIHQMLMNLAANARDAMPRGGRLTLGTHDEEAGDCPVVLTVADDGEGMDAATAEHIFEPFFTTKDASRGTGLGLASVYGIVKGCGGRIHVKSSPRRGSTFIIHFAATSAPLSEPVAPPAAVERVSTIGSAQILLVEDQGAVRRLFRRALVREGHRVIECFDGEDALARPEVRNGSIDLVLTDVMMPRLDGPSLVRQLRSRLPELPVLFTSGYPPGDLAGQAHEDPFADFLPKPFQAEDLSEKVAVLLSSSYASGARSVKRISAAPPAVTKPPRWRTHPS